MELHSSTYRLTLDDLTGEFQVWPLAKRELHRTEIADGQVVRSGIVNHPDRATQDLMAYLNRVPLFAASFAGGAEFHIDLDCGFQRWHGTKTEREVRKALKICGFGPQTVRDIICEAKIQEHSSVRRY